MKTDQGCHRFVVILDRIVIKFPNPFYYLKWFIKGFKGNIQEAKLSKTNKVFCPVIFSFPLGLFLVMKRAREITSDEVVDITNFIRINNITTAEDKMDSFGWLHNKLVCIDYENQ